MERFKCLAILKNVNECNVVDMFIRHFISQCLTHATHHVLQHVELIKHYPIALLNFLICTGWPKALFMCGRIAKRPGKKHPKEIHSLMVLDCLGPTDIAVIGTFFYL